MAFVLYIGAVHKFHGWFKNSVIQNYDPLVLYQLYLSTDGVPNIPYFSIRNVIANIM